MLGLELDYLFESGKYAYYEFGVVTSTRRLFQITVIPDHTELDDNDGRFYISIRLPYISLTISIG